jgi:hypothetical protein
MATPEPVDTKTPIVFPATPSQRPVMDEWGIYDPSQAGIEAMLRKIASPNDDTPRPPR